MKCDAVLSRRTRPLTVECVLRVVAINLSVRLQHPLVSENSRNLGSVIASHGDTKHQPLTMSGTPRARAFLF